MRGSDARQEPLKRFTDAAKALSDSLRELKEEAHLPSYERAMSSLQTELGLSEASLLPILEAARTELKSVKASFGQQLRDLARDAGYDFEYHPPNIAIGCVRLREKEKDAAWELSVLDDVVVEVVQTGNARTLFRRAANAITDIEKKLATTKGFLEDLQAAYDLVRASVGAVEYVSPNLLMLLCTYGRTQRKQLISATAAPPAPLSRAQMGYLIRSVLHPSGSSGNAPQIALQPATAHVAKDPHRFITVPTDVDPRRTIDNQPRVGGILITRERH
jgi:hypothetical protein